MKITETKEGVIIEAFVKPKSREFRITVEADQIVIYSTQPPTQGKANKEIIKEMSRLLKKQITLVSGFTSKQKCLLVKGVSRNEVETILFDRASEF